MSQAAQGSRKGRYREYRPDRGRRDAQVPGRSTNRRKFHDILSDQARADMESTI
jgi:hypothetical protein